MMALAPPYRYITLIVLGTALLSVSFLNTRFSEKIENFIVYKRLQQRSRVSAAALLARSY